MPVPAGEKPAFRCLTCGHLEHAGHAGDFEKPHACSVCGEGVYFNARGIKFARPDNWEVLADCPPERLAEVGLSHEVVGRHVWAEAHDGPRSVDASA
jgi:hypothetical protein